MEITFIPYYDEALRVVNDPRCLIDVIYAGAPNARQILITHSEAVAKLAIDIARKDGLDLDLDALRYASMLHDVGIVATNAPGIGCNGSAPYIAHGVIGADMLRAVGAPEYAARVAERHTGVGLTVEDIRRQQLPLPADRCLMPQNRLERLICYADKFYSKNPDSLDVRKDFERVRAGIARHGDDNLARFDALVAEFGKI